MFAILDLQKLISDNIGTGGKSTSSVGCGGGDEGNSCCSVNCGGN